MSCLLVCVQVGSTCCQTIPIRSEYRRDKHCSGGNLIRIDTDQCKVSSGVRRQCKAKCNGSSTKDPNARFSFVKIRGRKCIQFTDDRDGTNYALKVINGTNVAFEVQRCDNTTEDSFLFKEERVSKLYQYKHTDINRTLKLGVPKNCDENLSLISTTKIDRRCLFRKLRRRTSKNG
ncbi:uncharacterized protein LOC110041848 [Orbicella faveolata]|uniref:uncharacterized protein LOC110041848 n=1 Tax=Orbicella faveolata TaxID=48498 RepID=UPI0009E2B3BA|nr:uncharacterized protein LOC110041848 [Orbicella faveolata]